jgi:hypothetical protein
MFSARTEKLLHLEHVAAARVSTCLDRHCRILSHLVLNGFDGFDHAVGALHAAEEEEGEPQAKEAAHGVVKLCLRQHHQLLDES